jgi:hypothetical protein
VQSEDNIGSDFAKKPCQVIIRLETVEIDLIWWSEKVHKGALLRDVQDALSNFTPAACFSEFITSISIMATSCRKAVTLRRSYGSRYAIITIV